MKIVIVGLSLSSSWGNGHATTFRSLIRGLDALGHEVTFLERDVPWYADNRDLPHPDFCELRYYANPADLEPQHGAAIRSADEVIIGSYVPDGVQIIDIVAGLAPRRLSFYDIDTPVTLARLARRDEEYLARRQVPVFDTYFSFSGGPTLDRLQREFGARRARALYCSVDPNAYAPTGEALEWDLGYLGTYSADRQPILEKLLFEPARRLPERRFVVAGPMYPDDIVWGHNIEHIEHLPPAAHASFYSRQRFTLNITRADMVAAGWSPSVRLFEAAAVGTAIISDTWPGLDELLPYGKALIPAQRAEDVVEALIGCAPADRRRLADAAQQRVLEGHTGLARARELVEALLETAPRPVHRTTEPV